jgi:hypothetical protein
MVILRFLVEFLSCWLVEPQKMGSVQSSSIPNQTQPLTEPLFASEVGSEEEKSALQTLHKIVSDQKTSVETLESFVKYPSVVHARIVRAISSKNAELALQILSKIASRAPSTINELHIQGAMDAACDCVLSHDDGKLVDEALKLLNGMATNSQVAILLMERMNVMRRMLHLAFVQKEVAAWRIFGYIASVPTNRRKLWLWIEFRTAVLLVASNASFGLEYAIRRNAAVILGHLAICPENRLDMFNHPMVIPTAFRLMESPRIDHRHDGLLLLYWLQHGITENTAAFVSRKDILDVVVMFSLIQPGMELENNKVTNSALIMLKEIVSAHPNEVNDYDPTLRDRIKEIYLSGSPHDQDQPTPELIQKARDIYDGLSASAQKTEVVCGGDGSGED